MQHEADNQLISSLSVLHQFCLGLMHKFYHCGILATRSFSQEWLGMIVIEMYLYSI